MTTTAIDVAAHERHSSSLGAHVTRAVVNLAPPWLAAAAAWGMGAATNLALADQAVVPTAVATPVIAATGVGLAWLAKAAAPSRATLTRWHSAATVGVFTAWECACAITAPWDGVMPLVSGYAGVLVALSWNIRRLVRGSNQEGAQDGIFEAAKLAGLQMRKVEIDPNRVEAQLQLPAGPMTVKDVQGATPLLDKALGLRPGATRVAGDPDHAGRATMTIVPRDVLTTPQPWAGPSYVGGSITQPLVLGTHEDQQPMELILPGDRSKQRISVHMAISGQSGAGKSHGAEVAWVEIGTRYDVVTIIMDPVKGTQSLGLVEGLLHTVDGQAECSEVWAKLPDLISEQADRLGRAGFKEWEPEAWTKHGIPYFVVWVEEAARVIGDAKSTVAILQAARSAGISIVLSLQRASHKQIDTDARAQLNTTWCFGVQDVQDAAFLVSDEAMDAGVRPDKWGARMPGCSYLVWGGVPESRWPVAGRTPDTRTMEAAMRATLEAYQGRPAMPQYAADILGLAGRPSAPVAMTADQRPAVRKPAESDNLDSMPIPADVDEPVDVPGGDPEPELVGDADTELPDDDPDMPLPVGRPGRTEALQMLRDAVATVAGRDFTVRDLPGDLEERLNRGRSWVSGELARMAEAGELKSVGEDGRATVYRVVG